MARLKCPTCLHVLVLDPSPEIGQLIICQNCGERHQLIWLFPPELGPIEGKVSDDPTQFQNDQTPKR